MGKLIHLYSIPPLVSALFLFSLGIVALFSRKKEELWRTLAVFSLLLGAASAIAFVVTLIEDPAIASRTVRFAPFFGILALSFANYYAYMLTGRSGRSRLFGRRHVSGRLFAILISIWALVLAVLVVTGQLIANVEGFGSERPRVSFGSMMYVVIVLYIMGTIRNSTYLVTAYRQATDNSLRRFVALNVVAFHLVFGSVILFQFILPLWGFHTQLYAFLVFPIAVLIFYVAIVRYQFARVDDLNLSLERKVEERTAQLKRAGKARPVGKNGIHGTACCGDRSRGEQPDWSGQKHGAVEQSSRRQTEKVRDG
ncbi:MAG: hypothetical protein JSW58_05715 [Candidatus Latescibacterota bacterium]|nr:MAG: hypothetical protein JSW58_05715 [Candidatus Latescibacterota bacterium]